MSGICVIFASQCYSIREDSSYLGRQQYDVSGSALLRRQLNAHFFLSCHCIIIIIVYGNSVIVLLIY